MVSSLPGMLGKLQQFVRALSDALAKPVAVLGAHLASEPVHARVLVAPHRERRGFALSFVACEALVVADLVDHLRDVGAELLGRTRHGQFGELVVSLDQLPTFVVLQPGCGVGHRVGVFDVDLAGAERIVELRCIAE